MKSFEETKTEIINFMNNHRFNLLFGGHSIFIKENISKIFEDINVLMTGEKLEKPNIELETIERLIDIIMYNSIEISIDEKECEQIKNISQLIFNYNDNIYKNKPVMMRSTFLSHFLDGYLSSRECINLVRSLNRTFNSLKEFNPPSFELSKHYIDSIYGKNSKPLKDNNCGE